MFTNEQFLSPDFDEEAYLQYALHTSSDGGAAEQDRLATCMEQVKQSIQTVLADHSENMIEQVKATHKAQRDVATVRQSTDSLAKATSRLRLMIEEPYLNIRDKIQELENTNQAMETLRDVLKFISLISRLQEQSTGSDITRAARTLKELEDLLRTTDLRRIDVVEARMEVIEKAATTVRGKAHELLSMTEFLRESSAGIGAVAAGKGMGATPAVNKAVTDVGTALQCAHTLASLSRVLQGFMAERKREVMKAIMRELDYQSITEAIEEQHPQGGQQSAECTQEVLLRRIQTTLFITVQHTQCAILLWRILLRKQDPVTHVSYLATLDSPVQLLVDYWATVTDKLRERLASLQKRANFQAALTTAYPRYHNLLESFLSSCGAVGAAGEGAAAGATTSSAAATAALLSIQQCGMGDYVDLIHQVDYEYQVVTSGGGLRGRIDTSAALRAATNNGDTERLKQSWLTQVSEELKQRFSAQVLDRHRERANQVLSRLSGITPTSSTAATQQATVTVPDLRRPMMPPQANTLDVTAYTRVALHDAYSNRQDPHTMNIVLECALKCTTQVYNKMKDSVSRFPLPPLPSVTSNTTRAQLLHVCVTNASTSLLYDLTNILALLPDDEVDPGAVVGSSSAFGGAAAGAAGGAGGGRGSSSVGGVVDSRLQTLQELSEKRQQLRELIDAFRVMSERSSRPFLDSARVVLLPAISHCVESALAVNVLTSAKRAESASVLQLRSQMEFFLAHFYYLIDPRTSEWAEQTRHTVDALLARVLAQVTTTAVPGAESVPREAVRRALQRCVMEVVPIALMMVTSAQSNGVGRSTLLLKGASKQVELFYTALEQQGPTPSVPSEGAAPNVPGGSVPPAAAPAPSTSLAELAALLRPLCPLLSRLLVIQQCTLLASVVGSSAATAGGAVSLTLATAMQTKPEAVVEEVETVYLHFCDDAVPESTRKAEVDRAVQTCFESVSTTIRGGGGGGDPQGRLLCDLWASLPV